MPFGELVHVGPGHPFVPVALQRHDRQLDHVLARQQVVEQTQLKRVQHVFAVMQDGPGELHGMGLLVQENRLDHPVQAVGLTGRAVVRHLHAVQLFVAAAHALHFIDGALVVDVSADKNHVVLVVERRHHVFDHRRDDVVFQPRRNHDRQRLLVAGNQLLGGQRPVAAFSGELAVQPPGPVPEVDEQVIDTRYQNDQPDNDRRDFQHAVVMGQPVRPIERRHCGVLLRAIATGVTASQQQDEKQYDAGRNQPQQRRFAPGVDAGGFIVLDHLAAGRILGVKGGE